MAKKKAAPQPSAPIIPSSFTSGITPPAVGRKFAQSMSSVERMDSLRQMQGQKTASTHTALFGVGGGMGGATGALNPSNYTNPYTHNFPVDILERPQSRQEQIEWNVRWYRENPIVRRVIDLHSQLPLSKMTITKPSSSSQAFSNYIHKFFLDMARNMKLIPKLRSNLGKAYWLHGDDFIFLEDQKLEPNATSSEYQVAPSEYDNQARTNFFDVHKHIHTSSQNDWDKKYARVMTSPMLALVPQMRDQALLNAPPRPAGPFLEEREFSDVFGAEANGFLQVVHTLKNAAYELKKFADTLSGRRTADISKIDASVLAKLGPEFLSYPQHKAYVSYKTSKVSSVKVATEKEEDEGPSDVDMALDPSKRPVFKLIGIDPINVENIPRNNRSVSPTPNLDFQQFLQDNPDIQKALSKLPDPNAPVQVNDTSDLNVTLYGPDGLTPLKEDEETVAPESNDLEEGADELTSDLSGMDLGGMDTPIPDIPESPENDPDYIENLEIYNKNLKRKKELLDKIIDELTLKAADYRCFANIKYPKYKGWQAMRSLPPHQIEVARKSNSDVKEIFYIPSEEESATIQANFEDLSEEAQNYWKSKKRLLLSSETRNEPSETNKDLPADGSYCVQVSNARSDFELYGHGLIEPCLRDLMHDDKIGQVKSQTFARNMQPKRLVVAEGVDDMTLAKLQDMVDASTVDPDVSIITNYPVTWQEMGVGDRIQSFESEYSHILTNLTAGLAFFQEFITGQTTYGGSRTPQEIMNTMYLAFREDISFFIQECIFKPVAERKGFYDTDEFGQKVLIYPNISFSRLAIRDAGETYDMLMNLYLKGSVSISRIYEIMNIDEEEETQKLEEELFTIKDPKFTDLLTNIYQNVAQSLIERTNITEMLAKNLGLKYTEPAEDDGGGGMGPM